MSMQTDLWTFREGTSSQADLVGYGVEARDGGIGKVDEATYEAGGSFLVVDTGPWIFGKKVTIPAGIIERVDYDTETVFVDRTKDEIKNAPEFDPSTTTDPTARNQLGSYYGSRATRSSGDELL